MTQADPPPVARAAGLSPCRPVRSARPFPAPACNPTVAVMGEEVFRRP